MKKRMLSMLLVIVMVVGMLPVQALATDGTDLNNDQLFYTSDGVAPERYTVTVDASITNGTVTADAASAYAGEIITLTVTPAEGYALKSLTVLQGEIPVAVENNSFRMPDGAVTVTAVFEARVVIGAGEAKSIYVPLRSYYKNSASQVVIPAEQLEGLLGKKLTSLTYAYDYTDSSVPVEQNLQVYLQSVIPGTTLISGYADASGAVKVFDGTVMPEKGENRTLSLEFDTTMPYTYMGGDLLVTVIKTADNYFSYMHFHGVQTERIARYEQSDSKNYDVKTLHTVTSHNVNNFLPMMSFGYTDSEPHNIAVNASENGTVTVPATAYAGQTVTLTVTPAEGYGLKSLTVLQGEIPVAVENNSFRMPDGAVTVTAVFEARVVIGAGEAKSTYVPLQSYYKNSASQVVIPAEQLEGLLGKKLTSLTYAYDYTDSSVPVEQNLQVYLQSVIPGTTLISGYADASGAVKVFDGTVMPEKGENRTLRLGFQTPYTYMGGDLLVTVIKTADNYFSYMRFHGVETERFTRYEQSDSKNYDVKTLHTVISDNVNNFLPMMSFGYTDSEPHNIAVNASENGSATADLSAAYCGQTVTLTLTPDVDYKVGTVMAGEQVIPPVNGVYSFPMPDGDVTVTVTFETIAMDTANELADALTAGGTVTLTADMTIDRAIMVGNASDPIVLDLNGRTLTFTDGYLGCTGGSMTVRNGTVINEGDYGFYATNNGDCVLDKVTIRGAKAALHVAASSGTVTVQNSTLVGLNGGKAVEASTTWSDRQIRLKSGTFTGAMTTNGGSIEVTGGTFNADPSAFLHPRYMVTEADGIYTVSYDASLEGLIVSADELAAAMAEGGEIKLGKDITMPKETVFIVPEGKSAVLDLNGKTITWAYSHTLGGEITIRNGAMKGINLGIKGKITFESGDFADGSFFFYQSDTLEIIIKGGVFHDKVFQGVNPAYITLMGGTFANDPQSYVNDGATLPEGYEIAANTDGTWSVIELDPVAMIGETVYFSLEKAIAAANAGDSIVLQNDANIDLLLLSGGTLDLNDKTLTAESVAVFNGAAIIDSTNGGGRLAVPEDQIILPEQNGGYLPVKTEGGYAFVTLDAEKAFNEAVLEENTKYAFQPLFKDEAVHQLLLDEKSGVEMEVWVDWRNEGGYGTHRFVYSQTMMCDFLQSYKETGKYGKMFSIQLNGIEKFSFLRIYSVITSELDSVLEAAGKVLEIPESKT